MSKTVAYRLIKFLAILLAENDLMNSILLISGPAVTEINEVNKNSGPYHDMYPSLRFCIA